MSDRKPQNIRTVICCANCDHFEPEPYEAIGNCKINDWYGVHITEICDDYRVNRELLK